MNITNKPIMPIKTDSINKLTKSSNISTKKSNINETIFGQVFPISAISNGQKVIGYKVFIQYTNIYDIFGPYIDHTFAMYIQDALLTELRQVDINLPDINSYIRKSLEKAKILLYHSFPPLLMFEEGKEDEVQMQLLILQGNKII